MLETQLTIMLTIIILTICAALASFIGFALLLAQDMLEDIDRNTKPKSTPSPTPKK